MLCDSPVDGYRIPSFPNLLSRLHSMAHTLGNIDLVQSPINWTIPSVNFWLFSLFFKAPRSQKLLTLWGFPSPFSEDLSVIISICLTLNQICFPLVSSYWFWLWALEPRGTSLISLPHDSSRRTPAHLLFLSKTPLYASHPTDMVWLS